MRTFSRDATDERNGLIELSNSHPPERYWCPSCWRGFYSMSGQVSHTLGCRPIAAARSTATERAPTGTEIRVRWRGVDALHRERSGSSVFRGMPDLNAWVEGYWREGWRSLSAISAGREMAGVGERWDDVDRCMKRIYWVVEDAA